MTKTGVEWGGRGVEWGGRGDHWRGRGNQPAGQQPPGQQPPLAPARPQTSAERTLAPAGVVVVSGATLWPVSQGHLAA